MYLKNDDKCMIQIQTQKWSMTVFIDENNGIQWVLLLVVSKSK